MSTLRLGKAVGAVALVGTILWSAPAAADVTLVEKDGWTVYINGRMQAFLSYNRGNGYPQNVIDGNGNSVNLQGGGYSDSPEFREFPEVTANNDPGKIEDIRVRTGFTGNVLGFGIRKKLNADTDVLGYTAVTTYIESRERRKYLDVQPDWRQSYLQVTGPWGSVTAGRQLTLFSRGATEITYLYGFKYGLGYPGSINQTGPTAGHVGFGVLGNGFGAGFAYATPSLGGAQLTIGIYDGLVLPGSTFWERAKLPRAEGEGTYEMKIGNIGMFKLFVNGLWQKIYEREGKREETMAGVGYGGRLEVGPVHLGLAGHYGTGIGLNFALDPSPSFFNPEVEDRKFRTMDGYYAQLQVSPHKTFDIMAGAGLTEVQLLPEDKVDASDDDMNPATPAADDDTDVPTNPVVTGPGVPDSAGFIPVHRQIGLSGGVTYHFSDNLHFQAEYFRAIFTWYKPSPSAPDATEPTQAFHIVSAGLTYEF